MASAWLMYSADVNKIRPRTTVILSQRAYFHLCICVLTITATISASDCYAKAVFVGYLQSEQSTLVSNKILEFSPKGTTALLSFDITPDWSLSVDYTKLNDKHLAANNAGGELDVSSWGVGVSRYINDWSFLFSYSDWHDDLKVQLKDNVGFLDQATRSPSVSISGAYDWNQGHWQFGLSAGMHLSDWQQISITPVGPNTRTKSVNEGKSTFISIALSTAKLIEITHVGNMLIGSSFSWNQLTDSDSLTDSPNGRSISRVNNRTGHDHSNIAGITGTESYGLLNFYLSYDITDAVSVDVDSTLDLGGEQNTQAWSINLGYLF
jgi:hypothetical protein